MILSTNRTLEDTAFWKILIKIMRIVLIICSVVSTGCILVAVVLRMMGHNFYGSDEIILLFAMWLYFIGAAYGSYENSHIKADLLNMYIKNMHYKDLMNLIAQGLTTIINAILVVWATDTMIWTLTRNPATTSLKIPIAIPKGAIFIGLCLMLFFHVYYLYKNYKKYKKFGYFSSPNEGDYIDEKYKKLDPSCAIPTKMELNG